MTEIVVRKTSSLEGEVRAPSSKAYTQRMLIATALSRGTSKILHPLISDDIQATLRAVEGLGAKVTRSKECWKVKGSQPVGNATNPIDCGESGATLRFMVPVAALAAKPSVFTFKPSLAKRPIEPLFESLKQLGAEANFQSKINRESIVVQGGGILGGKTTVPGDISSQFISGLMFACPMAWKETEITLSTPLESRGYVQMTESVLGRHGIKVSMSDDFGHFSIPPNQIYKACDHIVPGDFSSAAFLLAAASIIPSKIQVNNLDYAIIQGDKVILEILKKMGIKVNVCSDSVAIEETDGFFEAFEVDAADIPDLVPVLVVLACYAKGTSRISGARRLQYKESNRLLSLYLELKKMGAEIEMNESSITVKGSCSLHGAVIDPHNDHRIAMACAIAALGASGETMIQNAECVRKSYPRFFTDLQALGADVVGWKLDR